MSITVTRGAGDRQGGDIIDPLLTSEPAQVARGRREIDSSVSSRILEQCQCPKHDFVATGSLAQIVETEKKWTGIVRYFSLTLSLEGDGSYFTADTGLQIEREAAR